MFRGRGCFHLVKGAFAGRRARPLDRQARVVRVRFVPGQKRRAEAEIELLHRFVARADRRNLPSTQRTLSQTGSIRASSAHFTNEVGKSKSTEFVALTVSD